MTANYALKLSESERDRYRGQSRGMRERDELWQLAGVTEGARVLDLGCGPGAVLTALADMVGPAGSLVGVDGDPEALRCAGEELADKQLAGLELVEGRIPGVELSGAAAGPFDCAVLRHLLVHNGGKEHEILRAASSLVRPGGGLYVMDTDMTMMRITPETAPLSELYRRYNDFQIARGNDLAVGTKLPDLLEDAGLEVDIFEPLCFVMSRRPGARGPAWAARDEMVREGMAREEDVRRWEQEFDDLDKAAKQPRYVLCGFVAVAHRSERSG